MTHIGPFLLVVVRIGGLFVFAPVLGSSIIPRQAKIVLLLAMSMAVYPTLEASQQVPVTLDLFSLGAAAFAEMLFGVSIGLLATVPIISVQLGGLMIGQQIGMGLADIYNPAVDSETTIFGQMLMYIALAVFLAMGGLDVLFQAVVESFGRVPLTGFSPQLAPLELLTGLLTSGFDLALRVAAPVLAIILLETTAMGFMTKTMPQLNILSVGFAIKIVAGIVALVLSLTALSQVISDEVHLSVAQILDWVRSLGG